MSKEEKKVNRRDFLFTASYAVGAVGLGAVVWPLVHQILKFKGGNRGWKNHFYQKKCYENYQYK